MKIEKVCILGGTGFVGSSLTSKLSARGIKTKLISRHPGRHRDLLVLPNVEIVESDITDINRLSFYLHDVDAVINLVGILNDSSHDGIAFRKVHVDLPKMIVQACQKNDINRLLHMSALNADQGSSPSHYLRTKSEGENHLHIYTEKGLNVTTFRPSVIFGPGDDFFNRFARLIKMSPVIYPVPRAQSKFAPVYVGDVTDCMIDALFDDSSAGKRFDLCGPNEYSMMQLIEYTASVIDSKTKLFALPDSIAKLVAHLSDFGTSIPLISRSMEMMIPGLKDARFSIDNFRSMLVDSTCPNGEHMPTAIEDIVPTYLGKQNTQHRYDKSRVNVRR